MKIAGWCAVAFAIVATGGLFLVGLTQAVGLYAGGLQGAGGSVEVAAVSQQDSKTDSKQGSTAGAARRPYQSLGAAKPLVQ